MFKDLSIKNKFLLLIAMLVVMSLMSGTINILSISDTQSDWEDFLSHVAKRRQLLMDIRSAFGYGGGIHNFKNLVLRANPTYADSAKTKLQLVSAKVEAYLRLQNINENEKLALSQIRDVVEKYNKALDNVLLYHEQELSVHDIDNSVRVDDTPALQAFEILNKEYLRLTEQSNQNIHNSLNNIRFTLIVGLVSSMIILVFFTSVISRNISDSIGKIVEFAKAMAMGDMTRRMDITADNEIGELAKALDKMQASVRELTQGLKEQDWLKSHIAEVIAALQGQKSIELLAQTLMADLPHRVNAARGAFYLLDSSSGYQAQYRLVSTYAYEPQKDVPTVFKLGEGIVGQCALDKRSQYYNDIPDQYIDISTGLGEGKPVALYVAPLIFENTVLGVLELASFNEFTDMELEMLGQLLKTLGILFSAAIDEPSRLQA